MSKLNKYHALNFDWVSFILNNNRDKIVERFSNLPDNVEFDIEMYRQGAEGETYHYREETDEEYSHRLEQELELEQYASEQAEKKRLHDQKNIDDTIANLKKQIAELDKVRPR